MFYNSTQQKHWIFSDEDEIKKLKVNLEKYYENRLVNEPNLQKENLLTEREEELIVKISLGQLYYFFSGLVQFFSLQKTIPQNNHNHWKYQYPT